VQSIPQYEHAPRAVDMAKSNHSYTKVFIYINTYNAVIGVLQIALVAKSNILYFHCVGAIAKMYRTIIITMYIMFSFDLVAGFRGFVWVDLLILFLYTNTL
jgi:hypothetical protein